MSAAASATARRDLRGSRSRLWTSIDGRGTVRGRNARRRTPSPVKRARRTAARRRSASRAAEPTSIRLWIRLTLPGVGLIGPGKIELLRQIQQHQSISGAARAMKMSYRRAWLLVDELNGLFAYPLVTKWLGGKSRGGAMLTPTGEKLVESYDTVVRRADRANRALLNDLSRSVRRPRA
jgi:molybdate transport system regulatory protein